MCIDLPLEKYINLFWKMQRHRDIWRVGAKMKNVCKLEAFLLNKFVQKVSSWSRIVIKFGTRITSVQSDIFNCSGLIYIWSISSSHIGMFVQKTKIFIMCNLRLYLIPWCRNAGYRCLFILRASFLMTWFNKISVLCIPLLKYFTEEYLLYGNIFSAGFWKGLFVGLCWNRLVAKLFNFDFIIYIIYFSFFSFLACFFFSLRASLLFCAIMHISVYKLF